MTRERQTKKEKVWLCELERVIIEDAYVPLHN